MWRYMMSEPRAVVSAIFEIQAPMVSFEEFMDQVAEVVNPDAVNITYVSVPDLNGDEVEEIEYIEFKDERFRLDKAVDRVSGEVVYLLGFDLADNPDYDHCYSISETTSVEIEEEVTNILGEEITALFADVQIASFIYSNGTDKPTPWKF